MERDETLWLTGLDLEPWTAPDGSRGTQYSDPIDHAALPLILTSPDTWDEAADEGWIGELTLSMTPKWDSFRAGRRHAPMATWTAH